MGSKRVEFSSVTLTNATYSMRAWPQTGQWQSNSVPGASPSRQFYFASQPFNVTAVYNTSYKAWGNFTVYVTHLSNNDTTISCHNNTYTSMHGVAATVNCTVAAQRHLQCPFTFRCFSPEMAAAPGPRCLEDFDNGYNDTSTDPDLQGAPKDAFGE